MAAVVHVVDVSACSAYFMGSVPCMQIMPSRPFRGGLCHLGLMCVVSVHDRRVGHGKAVIHIGMAVVFMLRVRFCHFAFAIVNAAMDLRPKR